MNHSTSDLEDEVNGLQLRLRAVAAPTEAMAAVAEELAAAWGEHGRQGYAGALDSARRAFHKLPDDAKRDILNGWTPRGPRPDRAELLAATECLDVRDVLSFTMTGRTCIPSRHWAFCDGDAPVRLEIQEGTTLEEVYRALAWIRVIAQRIWPAVLLPGGPAAFGDAFQDADLIAIENEVAMEEAWRELPSPDDLIRIDNGALTEAMAGLFPSPLAMAESVAAFYGSSSAPAGDP